MKFHTGLAYPGSWTLNTAGDYIAHPYFFLVRQSWNHTGFKWLPFLLNLSTQPLYVLWIQAPCSHFVLFVLYFENISTFYSSRPLDRVLLKAEPCGFLAYAYLCLWITYLIQVLWPAMHCFVHVKGLRGHKEFSHEYADVTRSMLNIFGRYNSLYPLASLPVL